MHDHSLHYTLGGYGMINLHVSHNPLQKVNGLKWPHSLKFKWIKTYHPVTVFRIALLSIFAHDVIFMTDYTFLALI